MKQVLTTFLLLILNFHLINAQQIIELENPSFEGLPRAGELPSGWTDCGFQRESPPDIQPNSFNVEKPAFDGNTYLGMVTRDNETWERVSQELSISLEANKSYSFSIYLAKADNYISRSRLTHETANYNTPIRLYVWGGIDSCGKSELLATSVPIYNIWWEKYDFLLQPTGNWNYLMLEAFYDEVIYKEAYNGNILIDNCSDIRETNETLNVEIKEKIELEGARRKLTMEKFIPIDEEAIERQVKKEKEKQKRFEITKRKKEENKRQKKVDQKAREKRAEETRQKRLEETKRIEARLVAKRQKKNDEFKQKIGTKELSEQDFLNIINTYPKKYLKGGKDKLVSRKFVKIYQAWEFEREVAQSGIKDYVFNHPQAYVRQTVAALTLVNARQKAEILHLTDKYANKPFKDKTKLELDYISNSNDLFTNVDEDVTQSILSFIKNNKTALTNELLDFLNQ